VVILSKILTGIVVASMVVVMVLIAVIISTLSISSLLFLSTTTMEIMAVGLLITTTRGEK